MSSSFYDFRTALPAGFVMTRELEAALWGAFVANSFQPISAAQAIAACGTPPTAPASLPIDPDHDPLGALI
jgi:hypothetical protein